MSQNFFAALDDSGDEAPPPVKSNAKKREPKAGNKPAPSTVVEPSKPDNRRKPNNHDRNTKFGRGGRGPTRDGKRQYDRRSGTGRGKEIKKGGGGARNWGSEKDEAKQREGKVAEEGKEGAAAEERAEGEGEEPVTDEVAEVPEPEPEPEDKTMTFEEYMASRGKKEEKTGRQVENEFQGKAAAKKVEEDFLVMGGGKQKKSKKKNADSKKTVEVGFRVANTNSGDGGRGGRGRGRGDRGGRGGRGGRDGRGRGRGGRGRGPMNSVPNVQDTEAFPSL